MNNSVSTQETAPVPTTRNYAVICCFFILGSVLGIIAVSSYGSASASNSVFEDLSYSSFFSFFVSVFKYHLIALAAGLLLFGFLAIPLIAAAKGFFVSFTSYVYLLSVGFDFFSKSFLVLFSLQLVAVVSMFFVMNSAMLFSFRLTSAFFDSQLLKRLFTRTFVKVFFVTLFIMLIVSFLIYTYLL